MEPFALTRPDITKDSPSSLTRGALFFRWAASRPKSEANFLAGAKDVGLIHDGARARARARCGHSPTAQKTGLKFQYTSSRTKEK